MEGLAHPNPGISNVSFLMFESELYHPRTQVRYQVTKKIITKNKGSYQEVKLTQKTKLLQSFEMLIIGSYTAYYMSMLNNLDPSPIPFVDMFKDELKNAQ